MLVETWLPGDEQLLWSLFFGGKLLKYLIMLYLKFLCSSNKWKWTLTQTTTQIHLWKNFKWWGLLVQGPFKKMFLYKIACRVETLKQVIIKWKKKWQQFEGGTISGHSSGVLFSIKSFTSGPLRNHTGRWIHLRQVEKLTCCLDAQF